MQINMGEPYWLFDRSQVRRLEADALYVGDFAVRSSKGFWSPVPVAVFYTPHPREGYTNSYFGVYKSLARLDMPTWMICDATSVAEHTWQGFEMEGEVIFSRWRHDMRCFSFGGPYVDGGADYLRVVGTADLLRPVDVRIFDGICKVV